MPAHAVGGHVPGSIVQVLLMCLRSSSSIYSIIIAFGFQLMLKLLPVTAEGVEILKTSLPSVEPWNFSQHSCMYVGVCSGMVGPTAWYNVYDIYIWCVETLLEELCSIVECQPYCGLTFVSR